MCFGSAPAPQPQPLPPKPTENDAETLARAEQERQRAIAAGGLGSTIVTGGLGASDFSSAGRQRGTNLLGQTT